MLTFFCSVCKIIITVVKQKIELLHSYLQLKKITSWNFLHASLFCVFENHQVHSFQMRCDYLWLFALCSFNTIVNLSPEAVTEINLVYAKLKFVKKLFTVHQILFIVFRWLEAKKEKNENEKLQQHYLEDQGYSLNSSSQMRSYLTYAV
jgi:hypothetical protein